MPVNPDTTGYEDMNTALTAAPVPETVETQEIPAPPEEVETPEVVAETTEEAENAALAAEETTETPIDEGAAPEAEEHKRSKAAEKRIAELVKQREQLKGQIAALSQNKPPQPVVPMVDPMAPPDPASYTDEIDYKVDFKLWERDRKAKDAAFHRQMTEITVKYPDLPELIEAANVLDTQGIPTANPTMGALIKELDDPGDLYHYLLSHSDEAVQIARMGPLQTAKAIGKIEAKLSAPPVKPPEPPKKPLPPPITPVKTGKAGGPPKSEFVEY
jgi:hypothetical protein